MMPETKITLLPGEMELISNPGFILTKNAIIQKLKLYLELLQLKQQMVITTYSSWIPQEVIHTIPKVSKGENYKGLPWLVLDYPRCFSPGNIFAIRTLFWWGNFFSITLHLSGKYKKGVQEKIIESRTELASRNFYISSGTNEWEHDISGNTYTILSELQAAEFEGTIRDSSFIKLSAKFAIESFLDLEKNLLNDYEILVKICC